MTTCKRGDVVLVRFPMPDLQAYKPRPAIVIQNDENNGRLSNTILLQVTSNTTNRDKPTQYFIGLGTPEGKRSGLLNDSVVKAEVIFTLPQESVYKKLGSLSDEAMIQIEKCIKVSLGMK